VSKAARKYVEKLKAKHIKNKRVQAGPGLLVV
jgi:hypothetical protein